METWLPIIATVAVIGVIYFVVKEGDNTAAQHAVAPSGTASPSEPIEADASPHDSWRTAGWTFTALGAIGLAFSLFMKTTVETSDLYGATSEVVNLDLQFTKGLAIGGSLFAIGLGAFCLGVGAIVKAIGRQA